MARGNRATAVVVGLVLTGVTFSVASMGTYPRPVVYVSGLALAVCGAVGYLAFSSRSRGSDDEG